MSWLETMTAGSPYPAWAAAAAAIVALIIVVFVLHRNGLGEIISFLGRVLVVTVGVVLVWVLLDRTAIHERMSDRRALDARAAGLAAQAIAPGSALACLDAMAGDTIETACEPSVFAGPAAVAAAVSYTAARLSLLSDAIAYAERADPDYAAELAPLRQALESDRFGLVAHVFAIRDSCTELQCDPLSLLRDPTRVQANLKDRTFESHVGRYAAEWPGRGGSPVAATAPVAAAATEPGSNAVSPRYDFPSAASIPPVSIMSAEPSPAATAAPAKPAAAAPVPPRRPPAARAAAPRPPAPAAPAAPAPALQISPPLAASEPAGQSLR